MSSPFGLLGTAAGVGEGLKELLTRRFLEQKQAQEMALAQARLAEETRSHQAEEAWHRLGIEESAKSRRDTAAEAAQSKKEAQDLREVNLAMMMPAGTTVAPERVRRLVQQGMAPEFFDQQPQAYAQAQTPGNNVGLGPPTSLMTAPPGSPQVTRFLGKQADLAKQQAEEDRNRRALEYMQSHADNIRLAASLRPPRPNPMRMVLQPDGSYTWEEVVPGMPAKPPATPKITPQQAQLLKNLDNEEAAYAQQRRQMVADAHQDPEALAKVDAWWEGRLQALKKKRLAVVGSTDPAGIR